MERCSISGESLCILYSVMQQGCGVSMKIIILAFQTNHIRSNDLRVTTNRLDEL